MRETISKFFPLANIVQVVYIFILRSFDLFICLGFVEKVFKKKSTKLCYSKNSAAHTNKITPPKINNKRLLLPQRTYQMSKTRMNEGKKRKKQAEKKFQQTK